MTPDRDEPFPSVITLGPTCAQRFRGSGGKAGSWRGSDTHDATSAVTPGMTGRARLGEPVPIEGARVFV